MLCRSSPSGGGTRDAFISRLITIKQSLQFEVKKSAGEFLFHKLCLQIIITASSKTTGITSIGIVGCRKHASLNKQLHFSGKEYILEQHFTKWIVRVSIGGTSFMKTVASSSTVESMSTRWCELQSEKHLGCLRWFQLILSETYHPEFSGSKLESTFSCCCCMITLESSGLIFPINRNFS